DRRLRYRGGPLRARQRAARPRLRGGDRRARVPAGRPRRVRRGTAAPWPQRRRRAGRAGHGQRARCARDERPARGRARAHAARVQRADGRHAVHGRRAAWSAGRRRPPRQGAGGLRPALAAQARAQPDARPLRPRAGPDGHADPALAGARRPRRGRRRAALGEPARGVQRDRPRAADRRRRVLDLARARPPLRPGPVRPRVRRRVARAAGAAM
ncbi:MAG: hypothetical transporter PduT for various metalloporphyrins, partial [uncultured Solirubrobacteraceae bacterium]